MRSRRAPLTVLCVAIVALTASRAGAQQSDSNGWTFELAPLYLWALGLDGDMAVQGQYAPVDVGFDDILDELEFAGTIHLEGRNAEWGFLLDATVVSMESEGDLPPVGSFPGGSFVAETDITLVEAMGYHRFPASGNQVDILFGARYMEIDADLTPPSPLPPTGGAPDWTDGVVGARLWTELSNKWSLMLRGDVASGGSDLTWNAMALFHREFKGRTGLVVGYRVMDVDYEDGTGSDLFVFDAQMSGPLLGFKIRWD